MKKDKGQVDAINKGIKKAKGSIITYVNADDLYEKNAFIKVVSAFNDNPQAIWFAGQGRVVNREGKEVFRLITFYKNILLKLNKYNLLLIVNYLMQPSVFITAKALTQYGTFHGNKGTVLEYEYWLKLGKVSMPVVIGGFLSKFRLTGDSKTGRYHRRILKDDYLLLKKYSKNNIILFLHKLHNLARIVIYEISK